MCISFLFKGSIIILQNYGEAKLSEGLMGGGCLVVGNINRSGKRCLLFSVGIFFFCRGPQRNPKSKVPLDLPDVPFPFRAYFLLAKSVFFSVSMLSDPSSIPPDVTFVNLVPIY